jgi:hypothetical protein
MGVITTIKRKIIAARFKRQHLSIVQLIPSEEINTILNSMVDEGWEVAAQHDTTASLDLHGECIIRRGQSTLHFTFSPTQIGEIFGPSRIIDALAKQYGMKVFSSPQY